MVKAIQVGVRIDVKPIQKSCESQVSLFNIFSRDCRGCACETYWLMMSYAIAHGIDSVKFIENIRVVILDCAR